MLITEVMDVSRIDLHLKGTTKDEILREIIDIFDKDGVLSDKEQFLKDVYEREAEGPTGMTNGLCIPHGKSDAVIRTSIAICRSDKYIEWESLDEEPVKVFVMMAVRNTDKSELVSLLSQVAIKLCDDELVAKLFETESASEVIDLFNK